VSVYLRILGRELPCDLADLLDLDHQMAAACQAESPSPRGASDFWRQGLMHIRRGELGLARARLSAAVADDPALLDARLALAAVHDALGRPQDAVPQILATLADPYHATDTAPLLCAAGFALERAGRWREAVAQYGVAMADDASNTFARSRLAAIFIAQGALADAMSVLRHTVQHEPNDQTSRLALAHLLYLAGGYEQALSEYDLAARPLSSLWDIAPETARELLSAGEEPTALQLLRRMTALHDNCPDLHLRLGNLYSRHGQDDAAVGQYLAAIELYPDYFEGHLALARHEARMGRGETAIEHLCRAVWINEQHVEMHAGRFLALHRLGRAADAAAALQSAARLLEGSATLVAQIGCLQDSASPLADLCEVHLDCIRNQAGECDAELSRHPGLADVRLRLATLLPMLGMAGQALEHCRQIVASHPACTAAHLRAGMALRTTADDAAVAETLEAALRIDTSWSEPLYRAALAYCSPIEFELTLERLEQTIYPPEAQADRLMLFALDPMQMAGRTRPATASPRGQAAGHRL